MTELKTLKDLEIGCLSRDTLKAEAVKDCNISTEELGKYLKTKLSDRERFMIELYIKWKNNLTEENLK